MNRTSIRCASRIIALALGAAALSGCTIYASDHDDEDWDSGRRTSAREEARPVNPPLRSGMPMSLVGRPASVHMASDQIMEGTVREMGDWVRLERSDGSTILIPREQIRYIAPIANGSTTQP